MPKDQTIDKVIAEANRMIQDYTNNVYFEGDPKRTNGTTLTDFLAFFKTNLEASWEAGKQEEEKVLIEMAKSHGIFQATIHNVRTAVLDEAIDKMQKLKQEKATGLMQANIVGVPILAELDEVIEALTTLKQTQ